MTDTYPLVREQTYCSPPLHLQPDILFVGSGIGLAALWHLVEYCRRQRLPCPTIVVVDAGPFDQECHIGDNPGYCRSRYIRSPERLGGKLVIWGVSTPRPRHDRLSQWPYPIDDIERRFDEVERDMGVPDQIPFSGGNLELVILNTLRDEFDDGTVGVAPLAINAKGRRWTPLKHVPNLADAGVKIVTRFRVSALERQGDRIAAVHGTWLDGNTYTFHPGHVVLGVGVEPAITLLSPVLDWTVPRPVSDHHRIDFNVVLPAEHFGTLTIDELGVAVAIVELVDGEDGASTPFHLEVKVAPLRLWREGHMQSSDNLRGVHPGETIYVQIQAVAAMKDPLPASEFVNIEGGIKGIRPGMTLRDARFHARIVGAMERVCAALRISSPLVFIRPLLQNHHLYRACAVGADVNNGFRSLQMPNLTVLPPSAYFPHECDANPTAKSLVLSQYAMEEIANSGKSAALRRCVKRTRRRVTACDRS